jgi:hypothetical protein
MHAVETYGSVAEVDLAAHPRSDPTLGEDALRGVH